VNPALEESVLPTLELVLDEGGDEVEGGELLRLGLQQAGFKAGGHAGAAELTEGALQLDEVHVGISSCVFCAMKSRYWVRPRMSGSTWRRLSGEPRIGHSQRAQPKKTPTDVANG
jgi:hypothetical protein